MVSLSKISTREKFMFLAYDHGLEHGPEDFTIATIDPKYILDIASKGKFNAVILQKGIAEKYYPPYKNNVPLIVKLNGKTNLINDEPYSAPLCTVDEAVKLGAKAVGYTIYVGSKFEPFMFKEFAKVVEQAHKKNLPVIAWMYPRGCAVKGKEKSRKVLAFAARIGLELGADILKMYPAGNLEDMKWVVKCAGKAKVIISGGERASKDKFLKTLQDSIKAGYSGVAVGRNVWQRQDAVAFVKDVRKVVLG